jgi:NTE family protein
MTKRALVLGGGGARGSYQIGMLEHLIIDLGLDFQVIRGVSVGALNAAYLAQASTEGDSLRNLKRQFVALKELWTKRIQGNDSVYSTRAGTYAGLLAGADSLYSLEPLKKLIRSDLDFNRLKESGRDFKVGYASLVSGKYFEVDASTEKFFEKLVASATIPVVFPHVELDGDALVDGGVRNITPLNSAYSGRPDEIYVLLTSRTLFTNNEMPSNGVLPNSKEQWRDNFLGTKVNGFDVLIRTLDIVTDEVYLDDIRTAITWNQVAKAVSAAETKAVTPESKSIIETIKSAPALAKKRYVKLYVLAPQEWYGDGNKSTEFSPQLISHAIEHGKMVAKNSSLWLTV